MLIRSRFILWFGLCCLLLSSSCHEAAPSAVVPKLTPNSGFRWNYLADTARYSVRYVSVTFDDIHSEEGLPGNVLPALVDPRYVPYRLTNQQELELHRLITTPSYYSEGGDCSTFQLNAGFVVYQGRQLVGKVDVGCGFNQWNYTPDNPWTTLGALDHGTFNDQGFRAMTKLLDAIYAAKPR